MTYLSKFIALIKEEMPRETIFVCPSRAAGRRLLALTAREDLLLGVRAETPLTLAIELCAEALAHPEKQTLMDDIEAVELVLECLEQTTDGYFSSEKARCLAAAREVYQVFQDLDMACVEQLGDSPKQKDLLALRERYRKKKGEKKRLDRGDLFRLALQAAKAEEEPLRRARYVVLGSYAPRPLERQLLDALSGGRTVVVPMDFPEGIEAPAGAYAEHPTRRAPLRGKNADIQAAACRGADTEVRHLFRTLLRERQTTVLDDCAVVYLSGEYGPLLYETAGRYGIPVSMTAGVPMMESPLYSALDRLAQLPESGFNAERIRELLLGGIFQVPDAFRLAEALRKQLVGSGRDRYARVWESTKPKDGDKQEGAEPRQHWEKFLNLIFALAQPEGAELSKQRENFMKLLADYTFHISPEQQAAYSRVRTLVGQVQSLLPGESLLSRVLEMMQTATYLNRNSTPGTLLCTTLSQALYTDCKKLYILGLSRYSLEGRRKENSVLLDAERAEFPALKTGQTIGQERTFLFLQLLLQHTGQVSLSYSDFDITRMTELQPAPVLRTICAECGLTLGQVSYLPGESKTLWDYMVGDKPLCLTPPQLAAQGGAAPDTAAPNTADVGTSLKELLAEFTFSASSLETALTCPLQFYLQNVLRLPSQQKTERGINRWLEANEMGTFCHRVLELYYQNVPQGETAQQAEKRLEKLFDEEWTAIQDRYPPTADQLVEQDRQRAEEMIRRAIQWTGSSGCQVLATEEDFGEVQPLMLNADGRDFRLKGTIDRVDRRPDGSYAILDYKTSKVDRFQQELEEDRHLQHYLYTLAEETLHPDRRIQEAGYLLLAENGGYRSFPKGMDETDYRKLYGEKVRLLLEWLEDEERIQTWRPCFRVENHQLVLGDDDTREAARKGCQHYCSYAAICAQLRKGMA